MFPKYLPQPYLLPVVLLPSYLVSHNRLIINKFIKSFLGVVLLISQGKETFVINENASHAQTASLRRSSSRSFLGPGRRPTVSLVSA